jgi:ribosomal protein L7Ae-like RNA K-turn-binding protein
MDEAAWRKVLGLVGLGARARTAVVGVDLVRAAAMRDKLALVIVASDASRHSLAKVVPLMHARRVNVVEGRGAAELGAAVGKGAAAAVGITDAALANGIVAAISAATKAV